jgi:hypothetical protein
MSRVSISRWCMHPSSISKALVGIQQHEWQLSRGKHGPDIEATFFDPSAGLDTLRTARPLSPGVKGSSMALRVVPHVHPDNYEAARAKTGSVTPASKVAGGKYLSSSIDMGSAACKIQTANLSLVPSSKDPIQPQTMYVSGPHGLSAHSGGTQGPYTATRTRCVWEGCSGAQQPAAPATLSATDTSNETSTY